jgi:hypothetical protein
VSPRYASYMERKKIENNVDFFIDNLIQQLLVKTLVSENSQLEIKHVINILLEIKDLIPEIVIDGDEMVKYFSKKTA